MKNVGIILSGGTGTRFGAKIPKQYMSLNGKLVIQYVIEAFQEANIFDQIIIVSNPKFWQLLKYKNITLIKDGATRNESINNAILACPKDTTNVFFHDAARPFLKSSDIAPYLTALENSYCAVTFEKITDALYKENELVNRGEYKLIQTPEAFRYSILLNWNQYSPAISIKEQFPCLATKYLELPHTNLKITFAKDIYIAEQLLKYQEIVKRIPSVNDKEILIFGGTGGIGSALNAYLTKLGAYVTSLGSKDIDLSNESGSFKSYNKLWDCIIYTAGAYATDNEGLIKNYNKIMNVNFRSFVDIVENASNMIKPGGSIIVMGSTCANKGREGIAVYSASKAALNAFVEAIYPSLERKNIKIQVICPAKVATKLQTAINPKADQSKMIQPDELAKIIAGYIDIPSTGNIVYIRVGQE